MGNQIGKGANRMAIQQCFFIIFFFLFLGFTQCSLL